MIHLMISRDTIQCFNRYLYGDGKHICTNNISSFSVIEQKQFIKFGIPIPHRPRWFGGTIEYFAGSLPHRCQHFAGTIRYFTGCMCVWVCVDQFSQNGMKLHCVRLFQRSLRDINIFFTKCTLEDHSDHCSMSSPLSIDAMTCTETWPLTQHFISLL